MIGDCSVSREVGAFTVTASRFKNIDTTTIPKTPTSAADNSKKNFFIKLPSS
jgi:hypothetical protein